MVIVPCPPPRDFQRALLSDTRPYVIEEPFTRITITNENKLSKINGPSCPRRYCKTCAPWCNVNLTYLPVCTVRRPAC